MHSAGANIIERFKNYLSFLDKSSICCGFESSGGKDVPVAPCDQNECLRKHLLKENDTVEERMVLFSSKCEVLADSSTGHICSRCRKVNKCLAQKKKQEKKRKQIKLKQPGHVKGTIDRENF